MTDFEQSIQHEIDYGKYIEIRDKIYRTEEHFGGYTYGNVSSWFVWKRDENGNLIEDIDSFSGRLIWEQDSDLLMSKLTMDIVFIGINMSSPGYPTQNWINNYSFQNARGVDKIVSTFYDTKAEGGYFTDVIKPDTRILNHLHNTGRTAGDSSAIIEYIFQEENENILREHLIILQQELQFLISRNKGKLPLLVVFGKTGNRDIIEFGINKYILRRGIDFSDVVYTYHYSPETRKNISQYKNIIREDLKNFITIPMAIEEEQNIEIEDELNIELLEAKAILNNSGINVNTIKNNDKIDLYKETDSYVLKIFYYPHNEQTKRFRLYFEAKKPKSISYLREKSIELERCTKLKFNGGHEFKPTAKICGLLENGIEDILQIITITSDLFNS